MTEDEFLNANNITAEEAIADAKEAADYACSSAEVAFSAIRVATSCFVPTKASLVFYEAVTSADDIAKGAQRAAVNALGFAQRTKRAEDSGLHRDDPDYSRFHIGWAWRATLSARRRGRAARVAAEALEQWIER